MSHPFWSYFTRGGPLSSLLSSSSGLSSSSSTREEALEEYEGQAIGARKAVTCAGPMGLVSDDDLRCFEDSQTYRSRARGCSTRLQELARELVEEVHTYLCVRDFGRLACVNRALRAAAQDSNYFAHVARRSYANAELITNLGTTSSSSSSRNNNNNHSNNNDDVQTDMRTHVGGCVCGAEEVWGEHTCVCGGLEEAAGSVGMDGHYLNDVHTRQQLRQRLQRKYPHLFTLTHPRPYTRTHSNTHARTHTHTYTPLSSVLNNHPGLNTANNDDGVNIGYTHPHPHAYTHHQHQQQQQLQDGHDGMDGGDWHVGSHSHTTSAATTHTTTSTDHHDHTHTRAHHTHACAVGVAAQLLRALEDKKAPVPLIASCISSSSTDRPEERAGNTLAMSTCFEALQRYRGDTHFSSLPMDTLGIRCQLYCGCCQGSPCYWSSRGSTVDEGDEEIHYAVKADVALVTSYSITPYQAFWHPQHPTYASKTARLEFRHVVDGRMVTYYASQDKPLSNTMTVQQFVLARPSLFLGGEIVLVLGGKAQRQTLGDAVAGEGLDNYYLCLSHVCVSGVPLGDGVYDTHTRTLVCGVQLGGGGGEGKEGRGCAGKIPYARKRYGIGC